MSTSFERIGREPRLQDYWIRRLVAFIIDSIIVSVITMILMAILSIPFALMAWATGFPWTMFNPLSFPFFTGILSVLYFTLFESYYGSTFGKRIMTLKTAKLDGNKPPLDLAFIRNISKIYWIFVLLDVIIGLATPGDPRQKVTDRLSGTMVMAAGASPFASVISTQPAKICANCGKSISDDAEYCPHCGKKQE